MILTQFYSCYMVYLVVPVICDGFWLGIGQHDVKNVTFRFKCYRITIFITILSLFHSLCYFYNDNATISLEFAKILAVVLLIM